MWLLFIYYVVYVSYFIVIKYISYKLCLLKRTKNHFWFICSQTSIEPRRYLCLAVAINICRRYTTPVAITIIQISITKISCNINNTDIKWTTTVVYSLPPILYRLHPNHSISGCNRHHTDWTIVIAISITTNNMKQVRRCLYYRI